MSYNPDIHHRHSIRLKGYDYAQGGLYFITICVQGRDCLLGNVANGVMVPNDAGRMVAGWYAQLENKFPSVRCHAMVVMPNHFHCILEIVDGMVLDDGNDDDMIKGAPTWAPNDSRWRPIDPRERPENDDISGIHVDETEKDSNVGCETMGTHVDDGTMGTQVGVPQRIPQRERLDNDETVLGIHVDEMVLGTHVDETLRGTHVGVPLHAVVGWFKTMTTNAYIRGVKNDGWKPFYGKLWQRNYYEHIIRNEKSYHNISEYIINNPSKWGADKLNPQN